MNEAINIIFSNGFGYPFGAFDMYVFKIEVPRTASVRTVLAIRTRHTL